MTNVWLQFLLPTVAKPVIRFSLGTITWPCRATAKEININVFLLCQLSLKDKFD